MTEVSPESKRRIIQALVAKVVVTRAGFELHYFVGVDQIKTGEASASPVISLSKKNYGLGSDQGLNGWGDPIVGEPLVVVREHPVRWKKPLFGRGPTPELAL